MTTYDSQLPMGRICTARRTNGEPCKRFAIVGGNVCSTHGGAAPQVKHAAEARLSALVDPAITRLTSIMEQTDNDAVALAAVKDILDRAGYKQVEKLQVETKLTVSALRVALGVAQ